MGQTPKDPRNTFLLIYFENNDEMESTNFDRKSSQVVLRDSYGNEYSRAIHGSQLEELFIAFVVPEWIANFTLQWPDNEPIQIEIP